MHRQEDGFLANPSKEEFPLSPFGLQSLPEGCGMVLPCLATLPNQRRGQRAPSAREQHSVSPTAPAALFPATSVRLGCSKETAAAPTLTGLCSLPLTPLKEASLSHGSINTFLVQIVIVERGLWINYYRDPHSGVKNFL